MSTKKRNKDPRFANCVKNQQEFGRAGKGGKLFWCAFHQILRRADAPFLRGRLTACFLKIIQSDPINIYGERRIEQGHLMILKDFEFNKRIKFSVTFYGHCTAQVNRATGECMVTFSNLDIQGMLRNPGSATHITLTAAAALLDFKNANYTVDIQDSGMINSAEGMKLSIPLTIPKQSELPLIVMLGISFQKVCNGHIYPARCTGLQIATIIKIDQV